MSVVIRFPGALPGLVLVLLTSGCPADFPNVPEDGGSDGLAAEASSSDGSAAEASGSDGQVDATSPDGDATVMDGPTDSSDASMEARDAPGVDASDACASDCTVGYTQCGTDVVQTCQVGTDGCAHWVTTAMCGTHQACSTDTSGAASCACVATACTQRGTVCQDSQTVTTCAQDSDGCLYVASTFTCSSPQVCSGMAPNAACSLTCSDSCSSGQKSCVSGGLATCTLGSNGCYAYGTPATCGTHEGCTGSPGSASCACNVDPNCPTVGAHCASTSSYDTCQADLTTGCIYAASTTSCSSTQVCVGGTCTCNSTSCPGCCDGTQCVLFANQGPSECGANGGACGPCSSPTAPSCNSGVCGCPPGQQNCGGSSCTDTQTDNANCGTCGHACPVLPSPSSGSSCSSGQCSADFGNFNLGPGSTALSTGYVYGIQVTVPAGQTANLQTFVVNFDNLTAASGSSVEVIVALYNDNGGCPFQYMGAVNTTVNTGSDVTVEIPAGGTMLSSGTWWFVLDGTWGSGTTAANTAPAGQCAAMAWSYPTEPPSGFSIPCSSGCGPLNIFAGATF